jgi:hypothetical protein
MFLAAAIAVSALTLSGGVASATPGHTDHSQGAHHAAMASAHHDEQKQKHHEEKAKHEEQLQASANLRVGLNNLLREHVTTNVTVNHSIAGGASAAEVEAGVQAQLANSDALAAAVGSIYGADAQAQFSEMFREHIEESNNYAIAAAAGDESAKAAAAVELQEYLQEIATFFSTAIPVLPYDAVYGLLSEHEDLINQSTVAFAAGDFSLAYQLEAQALVQVSTIADALAAGIIETQPTLFE